MKNEKQNVIPWHFILYFLVLTSQFLLLSSTVYAQESINITAANLEYLGETNTYIAKGSVKVIYEDTVLKADEVYLNNNTKDTTAIGNVVYEDKESVIKAEKMEINLDTKLGTLHNSYIFLKARNYHIHSKEVKKTGEESYSISQATATTCDATPPAWQIKGRDVTVSLHENLKAKNATFNIKNIPVLYIPYFTAPLIEERQTGLLIPNIGHSNKKGFVYKQGFFWAIEENRDASFYLDYYSRQGVGKGIDYRYIEGKETNGELWFYHLREKILKKDIFEAKAYHNQRLPYGMSGQMKLHLVSNFDYYDIIGPTSQNRFGLSAWKEESFGFPTRPKKYVDSHLHISKPFTDGGAYILGRYKQSLEGSSEEIPQYLPEAGVTFNTMSIGNFSFSTTATATNLMRESGREGQRIDIYPNLYFSAGNVLKFSQKVGIRETAYILKEPANNSHRELFDLKSTLTLGLFKKHPSFIHTIEPLLEYVYIPRVDHSDIPVFDSIDSVPEASDITYSLTNKFLSFEKASEATVKISQTYSLLNSIDKHFSPVLAEAKLSSSKIDLTANVSYDVHSKRIEEAIASSIFKWAGGFIGIGKSFRRATDVDQYIFEMGLNNPLSVSEKSVPLSIYGKFWYDVKGNGVQEAQLKTVYSRQCWGITISYTKRPDEYQVMFGIEFKGLGTVKIS